LRIEIRLCECGAELGKGQHRCDGCKAVTKRAREKREYRKLPNRSSRSGYLGRRGTEEECFWIKVDKTADCWLWRAALTKGYGKFRGQRAHRWSWERARGPIPEGMTIDHLCRNRRCVNPDHMELVSAEENARRAKGGSECLAKVS
jgi:hypothetical protein